MAANRNTTSAGARTRNIGSQNTVAGMAQSSWQPPTGSTSGTGTPPSTPALQPTNAAPNGAAITPAIVQHVEALNGLPQAAPLFIAQAQANADDWQYRDLAKELHRWIAILDGEFSLHLIDYPIIEFAPIRNAYATYAWFPTSMGLRNTITLNTHELSRPPELIIRTLGHELLHMWECQNGYRPKTNRHTRAFIGKAATCGLLVLPNGCTTGHDQTFIDILNRHGMNLPPSHATVGGPTILTQTGTLISGGGSVYGSKGQNQKMKKWTCGCTNIRAAVQVTAVCTTCGNPFILV